MWIFTDGKDSDRLAQTASKSESQDDRTPYEELWGKVEALDQSHAIIEFDIDGTILDANENFLATVGYKLEEIVGQHHRIFVNPEEARSSEYREFWASLKRGEHQTAEYKRFGKNNREIWLQASYNPICASEKVVRVVKYATDITQQTLQNANYRGQVEAAKKSLAVIEFDLDGTILDANENFLQAVGYRLDEIQGKHHRIFVDSKKHTSPEYAQFWENLNRGQFQAGQFQRVGNHRKEIWLQASYNPILDPNGKPFKIVKFATDITDQIEARARSIAIGQDVASSVTQMVQTIDEISRSVQRSADLAQSTDAAAKSAETEIESLTACSKSISAVVDVIRDLAEQTNLLALNATIEAARAGESGRGFAVVASEVKELAKQTSGATKDISENVASILSCIDAVVASTQQIEQGISKVSENSTTVAAAIEEQSTTMVSLDKTAKQLTVTNA